MILFILGILQYEVAAIPVWSLIYDTVKNEFQLSAARKQQSLHLRYDLDDAPTGIVGMDTPSELPIDMSRLVVIGDDMKLVQVFRNLISNGIKFSPVGSTIHIGASWVRVDGGADGEETTSSPQHREQRWTVRPGRRRKRRPSHDEKHRWVLRHQTVTLSKTKQDIVVVPKGRIRLTIRDEGPGLTKPQLEQIFEENTQFNVNELQGGQGSGLGLYIARGIVNHHKGNIQVSSQGLGHGTTFTITLPLYEQLFEQQDPQEELVGMEGGTSVDTNTTRTESILHTTTASIDEEQGTLPAPPPPPPTAITTSLHLQQPPRQRNERSLNILVVDDSVTNRKLLSRVLTNHGHYCDQASNGLEACEMAISYDYDCILMDYVMPVMDGPAAVSKIRNELRRVVLIVGITGNMLPEDVQHFTSCGANCVLPKPVKFDDLYNVWKSMNLI
jgi:CheY-like chemotaxis protein